MGGDRPGNDSIPDYKPLKYGARESADQARSEIHQNVPATITDRQLALAQQRALYSSQAAPSDGTPLPIPGSKPTPLQIVDNSIKTAAKRNPNELDHDPYADANKQNQTNPTSKLEPAPAVTAQPTLARDSNAPVANATDLTTKQAEPTAASTTAPTAEKPVTAKPTDVQPAQIIESPKPVAAEPPKPQQAADAVKPAPAVEEPPKPQPIAEAPKPQRVTEAPKPQPAAEAPKPAVAAEASRPQPVVQQSTPHAAEPKVQLVTEVPKAPSQAVHIATAEAMKPAAQATVQTAPKLEGTITHDAAPKSNDRSIAANKSAEHATLSSSKLSGQSASTRATEGSDTSTRNEGRKETRSDARTESRAESRSDIREAARELRGDKRVASDAAFGTHAPAAHDGGSKNGGTSIETGSHGSTGVKHDADTKQDGGSKHHTQGKADGTTQGKAEGNKQVSDATKHEVDAKHDTSIKHEANQQNHADTTKGGSAAVGSHGDTGVRTESGSRTEAGSRTGAGSRTETAAHVESTIRGEAGAHAGNHIGAHAEAGAHAETGSHGDTSARIHTFATDHHIPLEPAKHGDASHQAINRILDRIERVELGTHTARLDDRKTRAALVDFIATLEAGKFPYDRFRNPQQVIRAARELGPEGLKELRTLLTTKQDTKGLYAELPVDTKRAYSRFIEIVFKNAGSEQQIKQAQTARPQSRLEVVKDILTSASAREQHVVQFGQTLRWIAWKSLDDIKLWPLIAKINGLTTSADAAQQARQPKIGSKLLMPTEAEIAAFRKQIAQGTSTRPVLRTVEMTVAATKPMRGEEVSTKPVKAEEVATKPMQKQELNDEEQIATAPVLSLLEGYLRARALCPKCKVVHALTSACNVEDVKTVQAVEQAPNRVVAVSIKEEEGKAPSEVYVLAPESAPKRIANGVRSEVFVMAPSFAARK